MTKMSEKRVLDASIADDLLVGLQERVDSPAEAAAMLVLALWKLSEANDTPRDVAIESIATIYRSIERVQDPPRGIQ